MRKNGPSMIDILVASTKDLMKANNGKKLEELLISDFMVGTYNKAMKSNVVIFTDGTNFRIVKNKKGILPSNLLSHEEILEFIKDRVIIEELI